MSAKAEAYVWLGPMVDTAAVTALQRQVGDRLRVPCQRLKSDDGHWVYAVDLLEHNGPLDEAGTVLAREIRRWAEEHAVVGAVDIVRLHVWRT